MNWGALAKEHDNPNIVMSAIDEIDDVTPTDELALTRPEPAAMTQSAQTTMTSAQARIDSVSRTMDAAMSRASTLQLTSEEVSALKADFPDEAFKPGAAGKESLIYIEHAFLRDRMNEVVGMGQWALLRTRPHWAEEFTTLKGERATRIYADCVLLVRGCMVSEAIGDMVYYPNNATQNYGDAAEGAMTAAFRRCAKNFGIGLQAWKKDWCEGWWQRKRGVQGTHRNAPPASPSPKPATLTPQPPSDTTPASKPLESASSTKPATKKERTEAFMALLEKNKAAFLLRNKAIEGYVLQYLKSLPTGGLMPNETLEDLNPGDMFLSATLEATAEENQVALRADYERHMAGIKRLMDAANQIPGAEVHDDAPEEETHHEEPQEKKPFPPGTMMKRIRVVAAGQQEGRSNKGPWTRYWVKDGDGQYYSTFERTTGLKGQTLKDQDAEIWFTEGEKGNAFVELSPATT